jgi:hypothetical protein
METLPDKTITTLRGTYPCDDSMFGVARDVDRR